MALIATGSSAVLKDVHAEIAAGRDANVFNVTGPHANPGLQRLIAACRAEMSDGSVTNAFIRELAHFNRPPAERNLQVKLADAGQNERYYEFALEAKESFAKFFEVLGRHPTGQEVLVAAFSHAYSVYREKIYPNLESLSYAQQSEIFETEVVLYLSHNLTGLPGFYGRNESLGLLFYLADNCFIEYTNV